MQTFDEGRHPGEGLLSEASGSRSRGAGTIKAGAGVIKPGTILGRVTADKKLITSPDAVVVGSEGAETAVAIALYGCDATTADQDIAIIERDAEWNVNTLIYDASVNDDTKKATKHAQLAAVGIITR